MKTIALVLACSGIHFFISFWLSIRSFSHTFSAFDTGRDLTILEKINYIAVEILFFPVVTIFEKTTYDGSGIIGQYIPFIMNSTLWGLVLVYGYKFLIRKNT